MQLSIPYESRGMRVIHSLSNVVDDHVMILQDKVSSSSKEVEEHVTSNEIEEYVM